MKRVANTYFTKENRTVAVYTRKPEPLRRANRRRTSAWAATHSDRADMKKSSLNRFASGLRLAGLRWRRPRGAASAPAVHAGRSLDASPTGRKNSPSRRWPTSRRRREQYRVQLKSGPVAYVVPDRELPLVNIAIYVRTGDYLEPAGKEGLAEPDRLPAGARRHQKSKTAEELEERLAFLAAHLNSGVGDTQGSVSLNLLSKDLDEGLAILREVLTAPRFQEDKIALRKQQMLQAMKQRNDDSADIEAREQGFLAFGEHFWANRYATAARSSRITRDDLEAVPPASGFTRPISSWPPAAISTATQMMQKLETLFADWPFAGREAAAHSRPTPPSPRPAFTSWTRTSTRAAWP